MAIGKRVINHICQASIYPPRITLPLMFKKFALLSLTAVIGLYAAGFNFADVKHSLLDWSGDNARSLSGNQSYDWG